MPTTFFRKAFAGALLAVATALPYSAEATMELEPDPGEESGYKVAIVNYKFYCYSDGQLCIVLN